MTKIYNYEIDLNADTTHNRSIRLIGHGKRVLEFGCATGYISKVLTEQFDCTVTGIESNPDAVAQAQLRCHRVIRGDAESLDYETELNGERFDVVLFGDVLEHLKDPWTLLRKARDLLAAEGYVVASIPNVAHASVALELLAGRFTYQAEGLLDEAHLRFFTRRSIQELFEATGYVIAELSRITVELSATQRAAFSPEIVEFALRQAEALTYQFVIKAYPAMETGRVTAPRREPEGASSGLTEREAALRDLRREVESTRRVLAEREAAIAALRRDLSRTRGALTEVGQLRVDLASARTMLQVVTTSRSWKLTAPLRWLKMSTAIGITRVAHRWSALALQYGVAQRAALSGQRARSRSLTETPDARELSLPTPPSTPLVSIIIPVYNQLDLTLRCLKAIQDNSSAASAEIIVLDDASHDETAKILPSIPGVRYIRNHTNLGFLRSCNRAASEARGEYLVFLNNDTEVLENWLDQMLAVFEHHEHVGIVGAKLIYPDGRLQETGGLVWSDGSAINFGRDDDPTRPEYSYVREADYCSAACLLIKASLFRNVKGFDELFAPAYYEDVDLAFKVREQGHKVMCQPAAQVIHAEGGTCGTDLNSGVKSYQQINAKKFSAKWGRALQDQHAAETRDLLLARDRGAIGRCLFVDVWPTPDRDAGSIYTIYLIKLFQRFSYKIAFFPANTTRHFGGYTEQLQQMGIECLYEPFVTDLKEYLDRNGDYFDVVVLCRADQAIRYLDDVRANCHKAKVIFHTVDLHFLREERSARLKDSVEELENVQERKRAELEVCKTVSATLVPSMAEASLLAKEVPDAYVECFPFALDLPGRQKAFSERRDIAFIAGYLFEPNVDAVVHFVRDIWPHIAERLPDAQFLMVGSNMPESVARLASERIKAIGYVKNLTQFLENCRLTVAPIRYGAGIKGKIISSLTHGVPVVATSLAAEGMGCAHGVHLLVADTIPEWTESVTRAYNDERLWEHLSDNGLALMRETYSLDAGVPRMRALLQRLECPLSIRPEEGTKGPISRPGGSPPSEKGQGSLSSIEAEEVKLIAFYLPQYHPIPENDKWWGKGFTEWTFVTRAQALFRGHYQPHLPSELGFYDLRMAEVREAQAALAEQHGIHGFCYYHYWFGGKRLLDRPLSEVLASGRPEFPFCLCWANEDWTRRWDGSEKEILLKQEYSPEGDRSFIRELLPILSDRRYIRVNGKPLLVVYRTESLPNARETADTWREASIRAGVGDLYLCRVESFSAVDPESIGFDAAIQFPPLLIGSPELDPVLAFDGTDLSAFKGKMFDYRGLVRQSLRFEGHYKRFWGVTPSWDNTPRRGNSASIWLNNSPMAYEDWLAQAVRNTLLRHRGEERLIFINAWNEWGEGCHLEPDQYHGRAFLEATRRAAGAMAASKPG
jgi:GT2 family glycosyltransferase/2-polyprenyl-3-methyl-5-hydroxy-6-metoxy-1,4-benzoquinol methylase